MLRCGAERQQRTTPAGHLGTLELSGGCSGVHAAGAGSVTRAGCSLHTAGWRRAALGSAVDGRQQPSACSSAQPVLRSLQASRPRRAASPRSRSPSPSTPTVGGGQSVGMGAEQGRPSPPPVPAATWRLRTWSADRALPLAAQPSPPAPPGQASSTSAPRARAAAPSLCSLALIPACPPACPPACLPASPRHPQRQRQGQGQRQGQRDHHHRHRPPQACFLLLLLPPLPLLCRRHSRARCPSGWGARRSPRPLRRCRAAAPVRACCRAGASVCRTAAPSHPSSEPRRAGAAGGRAKP